MRILALETSSTGGSAAVVEGERLLAEVVLPESQRSAQALAPALQTVLTAAGWKPHDVQLVAVTEGPGSFTGLRVGAATAKTFAYAAGAQIAGVNTLQAIAAEAPPSCRQVWTLLDAYRGQLFVGRYALEEDVLPVETEATAISHVADWLARLAPHDWIAGPGVRKVAAKLPAEAQIVANSFGAPRAATVAQLARLRYEGGARHDVWSFVPQYYRASAAEEKNPA